MPLLESVKSIIFAGIYWLIANASCYTLQNGATEPIQ